MIDTMTEVQSTMTEHYFLKESNSFELSLNFNGMSLAAKDAKLGQ